MVGACLLGLKNPSCFHGWWGEGVRRSPVVLRGSLTAFRQRIRLYLWRNKLMANSGEYDITWIYIPTQDASHHQDDITYITLLGAWNLTSFQTFVCHWQSLGVGG